MLYKGSGLTEISFPLGGIGTGSIGLAGNGRLIDWEIANRPNKGSYNGFSHFAVKAEKDGKVLDARVLNSDFTGSYSGVYTQKTYEGYGYGPDRGALSGAPHFRDLEFTGEFPFAKLDFIDDAFPGALSMTAFNPLIPTNDGDSTIPAAFFSVKIGNNTPDTLNYTICLSVANPLPKEKAYQQYCHTDNIHQILFGADLPPSDIGYGELAMATDGADVSYQESWYRGMWFDNIGMFWRNFKTPGKLENRRYDSQNTRNQPDTASLAAHVTLRPGEQREIRFVISWNYPNQINDWAWDAGKREEYKTKPWKNYYAVLFKNAQESALYALANWDRLYEETKRFKDALFSSSLPDYALDAVSANLAILKSPTVLRLTNGEFYGWEGVHCYSGSCEGTCTHVWNYAYALPFLFPKLERSIRDLDFRYNLREDGGKLFRLRLPLGEPNDGHRPCADGQFGDILKMYREWKICGDTQWLRDKWPAMKKSIAFAWSDQNIDCWDRDKDGVLEGRQHHTLDMELFGPNSWLTGFYLAALKAGAEMADALDDRKTAAEYRELFAKGKQFVDGELFNGKYYGQKISLGDKSVLEKFSSSDTEGDLTIFDTYWNSEAEEIKFQIGEGCGIDQVLAQWHANLIGLGEIFDPKQTKSALRSIFRYNYRDSMREVFNPCRVFSLNDEAATMICTWPEGAPKPFSPLPYAEETMNGFEYQVGIHMLQEGLIEEGEKVIKAVRSRYNGEKRNPWGEFECGSDYARSMASYALLNAYSGFTFDMCKGIIGFSPILPGGDQRFFFSLDSGWGMLSSKGGVCELHLLYGELRVREFHAPDGAYTEAALNGRPVEASLGSDKAVFTEALFMRAGDRLTLK